MFVRAFLDSFAWGLAFLGFRGIRVSAHALAFLAIDVFGLRRRVVLENLDTAFGDALSPAEKRRLARVSTANFIRTALEFFASGKLFPLATVTTVDREHLDGALAGGKGAYAMLCHLGHFELMAARGTALFTRVNAVTKPVGKGAVAAWVRRRREANGHFEILDGLGTSRQAQIFAALARNEIVGFMVDQRRSRGMRLPFFGQPALTNTSLFTLWKRQNAPIVPAIMVRTCDRSHSLIFFPEFKVETDPGWSDQEFIARNAVRMNAHVEAVVRAHPEQYFWLHKRWK